jgi:C1A family cysteine protease
MYKKTSTHPYFLMFLVFLLCFFVLQGCSGGGGGGSNSGEVNPTSEPTTDPTTTGTVSPTQTTTPTPTVTYTQDPNWSYKPEDIAQVENIDPNGNWTPGVTIILSEYTEEGAKTLCGAIKEKVLPPKGMEIWKTRGYRLPSSFSWKNKDGKNWMTIPKDQNPYGTCVAFAVLGSFEAVMKISKNDPSYNPDLSEWYLFYKTGGSLDKGMAISTGVNYLYNYGTVTENECPYSSIPYFNEPPSGSTLYKASDYKYVEGRNNIKEAILNGPVIGSFDVYNDFFAYQSGVYSRKKTSQYNSHHAIVIVGWDDSQNAWICKNSWYGEKWGEGGYFRIVYDELDNFAYTVSSPNQNDDAKFLQYPWGTSDFAPENNTMTKKPGEEFWIDFKSLNTGTTTWTPGKYYFQNNFKSKGFGSYSDHYYLSGNVTPGGTWGYQRFNLKAPTKEGVYTLTCRMGKDSNTEFGSYINYTVTVTNSTVSEDNAIFLQWPWGSSDIAPEYNTATTKQAGEEFWIDYKALNNGKTTWSPNSYYFHNNFAELGFSSATRQYPIDATVAPGGTWGYKRFILKAPSKAGVYTLTCRMGKQTNTEFGSYINWKVTVVSNNPTPTPTLSPTPTPTPTPTTDYDAKFLQWPWGVTDIAPEYSSQTKKPGEEFWIDFKSLNTGTATWYPNTFYFHNNFAERGFSSHARQYPLDVTVSPGGTWGYKRFILKAPSEPGIYYLTCRMGRSPNIEFGNYINWIITVKQ